MGCFKIEQSYPRVATKYVTRGIAGKGSAFVAVVFGCPILHDVSGVRRQEVGDGLSIVKQILLSLCQT